GSDQEERHWNKHLVAAAVYFGALCLCKTVYVVLLPAIITVFAWRTMSILTQAHDPPPHLNPLSAPPRRDPGGEADAKRQVRVLAKPRTLSKQLLFFWLPIGVFLCLLGATNW